MPINKETSKIIAISLKNDDLSKLEIITADLSQKIGLKLTKSQTIALLINNYGQESTKKAKEQPQPRTLKNNVNYGAQIRALKDKLHASFTELAQMLDIPASTLKKYASDTQQPKAENEQKILNALKRYGIK